MHFICTVSELCVYVCVSSCKCLCIKLNAANQLLHKLLLKVKVEECQKGVGVVNVHGSPSKTCGK